MSIVATLSPVSEATGGGFRQISPTNAAPHLASLKIIDVREPSEFNDALGHIPGASLVPLGTVLDAAKDLDRSTPILLVCKSGGRSGRAAGALAAMGFPHLYNLAGGMMGWNDARLPVER